MAKTTSYRGISASQITHAYRLTKLLWIVLQILAVLAAPVFIAMAVLQKMSWFNGFLWGFTMLAVAYLLSSFKRLRLTQYVRVLHYDCDPVKLEKVFAPLDKHPEKFDDVTLNIVRALFYQGRFDEARERLQKAAKPDLKNPYFFQYYNMLANCADMEDDLDKLLSIRQKIETVSGGTKPNSGKFRQCNQLLALIEVMILHKEGRITPCKEACKDMLKQASYPLSRMNFSLRLARLERLSGANHTAAERCAYVIDDGGTTFYVREAEELYRLCCGKDYVPEDGRRYDPEDWDDEDAYEETDSETAEKEEA